jgi:excisionase family DNA binding protein
LRLRFRAKISLCKIGASTIFFCLLPSGQMEAKSRLSAISPNDLYSEKQAAQLLGISRVSLWRLREAGEIQIVPILGRMVRFRGRQLLAFIERAEKNARRTMRQRRTDAGHRGAERER